MIQVTMRLVKEDHGAIWIPGTMVEKFTLVRIEWRAIRNLPDCLDPGNYGMFLYGLSGEHSLAMNGRISHLKGHKPPLSETKTVSLSSMGAFPSTITRQKERQSVNSYKDVAGGSLFPHRGKVLFCLKFNG